MYCPQCGQQQVSEVVRFCPRCGFPLDGVVQLLEYRGLLPSHQLPEGEQKMSPRKRAIRQGGILLLSAAFLVPILGVLDSFARSSQFLDMLVAIAAIICFVGGPLRMLFAALFEEGAPARTQIPAPSYFRPVTQPARSTPNAALPPAAVNPGAGWRPRPNTAELVQPPSVTENTTRLLDQEEPRDR